MALTRRKPAALAAGLAVILIAASLPVGPFGLAAAADQEPLTPSTLMFPQGGGSAYTNLSLERGARVTDARLVMRGDTIERPVANRVNATTVAAGRANAWSGGLALPEPDQPPEAYIATPFNATQVANVSAKDGALAMSPIAPNFTYQLYIFQISTLDVIELRVLWSGYSLPPSMPIFWSGKIYLYNFTSLAWENVSAYPYPLTGVQDVTFNTSYPPNFVKPGTGSVAAMVVSESSAAEMYTDVFEVTTVVGVFPTPAVDVGNDGSYDWRFDAPGWGALGRQTEFESGTESTTWTSPPGGAVTNLSFLLPAGADVDSASLTIRRQAETGWTNRSGANMTVAASTGTAFDSTGIPSYAVGRDLYLTVNDIIARDKPTDSNLAPQVGSLIVGSDPSGFRAAGEWISVATSGRLARISVPIAAVSGSPGDLRMDLEGRNATGFPDGVLIGSAVVNQSLLANGTWIDFWFSGIVLAAGTNISVIIRAPMAPPDTASNYARLSTSANDSYGPGESLSYFNVTGLGETWGHVANADLEFVLTQDLPLASTDAFNVRFEGQAGTFTVSFGLPSIQYVINGPTITSPNTTWILSNQNSYPISFNYTLELRFEQLAQNLTVSFENGSSLGPQFQPNETGLHIAFATALRGELSSPREIVQGSNGVAFARVSLNLSAVSAGVVDVASLDIRYALNLSTADLSASIDTHLWSLPPAAPRASVPIRIYSPGASQLELLRADITYDRPPEYFGFPTNESLEDIPIVVDLNTVFHDDFDNANLAYTFDQLSGAGVASVALRAGYNLTITPFANTSGTTVVNVTAFDSSLLSNWSGPITFTFLEANDPPFLTVPSIDATWGQVFTVDLTPYIVDAESAAVTTSISAVSGASATVVDRSLVFDFPVNASDVDLTVTLSDGLDQATYPLHVHPRQSNTVPELLPIPTVDIANNGAYRLNLALFAHDAEDALSALHFELSITSGNASALSWAFETNATSTYLKLIPRAGSVTTVSTQLRVTDSDGNAAVQTIGIRIVAPPNVPPRIVGLTPTVTVSGDPAQIFLVTKYSDPEDASDPANLTWEVVNGDPQLFDADINRTTQVLTITPKPGASGIGTISLILHDSGGATDTRTIEVTVNAPAPSSSTPTLALGLFFAGVVLLAAIFAKRNRDPKPRRPDKPLTKLESEEPSSDEPTLYVVPPGSGDEIPELPSPEASLSPELSESPSSVGDFLRGITDAPGDEASGSVVAMGVKSGLGASSSPEAAAEPAGDPHGHKPPARLAELYLVSVKDGSMLYQVPPIGVPPLASVDENEFLQWAFDTVRHSMKRADAAKPFEWKGTNVLIARGNEFFIVGRTRGENREALARELGPLMGEVDHNFPGDTQHWQMNEVVETVGDVLRRLVK